MCLDIVDSMKPQCLTGEGFSIVRRKPPLTFEEFRYIPVHQAGPEDGYRIGVWYRADAGVVPVSWPDMTCYSCGFHVWRKPTDAWSYLSAFKKVRESRISPVMVQVQWRDQLATGRQGLEGTESPRHFGEVVVVGTRMIQREVIMMEERGELRVYARA